MGVTRIETTYQKHILHYYNRLAFLYDFTEFIRRGTRKEALRLSGWIPGDSVLDLCTGTGELALTFASAGAHAVGVDIARNMLKRAHAKNGNGRTAWMQMDSTHLAFADNAFDISVISLALHHMPETVQAHLLGELCRVTRKRVILIEPNTPVDPNWVPLWKFVANIIDESEHMHEWADQNLIDTCARAGLHVDAVYEKTLRVHQILVCTPQH